MATRHISLQKQAQFRFQFYLWFFSLSFSLPLFLALHSPLSYLVIFPDYSFSPSFLTILHRVQCTKYRYHHRETDLRNSGGSIAKRGGINIHLKHTQIQQAAVRFPTPSPQMTKGNSLGLRQSCLLFVVLPQKQSENCTAFSQTHKIFPRPWRKHWFSNLRLILTYCTRYLPSPPVILSSITYSLNTPWWMMSSLPDSTAGKA